MLPALLGAAAVALLWLLVAVRQRAHAQATAATPEPAPPQADRRSTLLDEIEQELLSRCSLSSLAAQDDAMRQRSLELAATIIRQSRATTRAAFVNAYNRARAGMTDETVQHTALLHELALQWQAELPSH